MSYTILNSTKIAVCHNKRIHNNKVFSGIAISRGKTSVGWFYEWKLFIVVNPIRIVYLCKTCRGKKG
ncbi:transposase [Bacteroidetes bacterium endosymbiont of Geopemphigus sp.]|uniref:transposase n=1 Tax=Bacteroidetes bacterium endosymbiont of Geopemphigus sp. TaxID=2047937 RepID=UPI000CD25E6F